jgi:hypothetical protein
VAFHPAGDDVGVQDAPLTVSLVALWHDGRVLLVFNRQHACWELPGGSNHSTSAWGGWLEQRCSSPVLPIPSRGHS